MVHSNDLQHTYIAPIKQADYFDDLTNLEIEQQHLSPLYLPDSLLEPSHMPSGKHVQYHSPTNALSEIVTNKQVTIFSFFSGAGFLDLGFETSGFKIAYVNEIYRPFLKAYQYAREELNIASPEYGYDEGDISNFVEGKKKQLLADLIQKARQTSDIVGFIGGPPCPDFSVGGKNRGREGDHGRLTAIYIELICQQKPDFFVFENVKGLWRTKKHREFFDEMKQKLYLNGYVTTEKLVNAIEYGTPQDRERIILSGFRKHLLSDIDINLDSNSPELPVNIFPWEKYVKYPKDAVFISSWPVTTPFEEDSIIPCQEDIIQELTVEYWFRKNNVLNHLNAEHHFKPKAGITRFISVDEGDDSKKSFKRLHRWRYSPTACYGNNEVHLHPYKVRRISAAEALALQSLPSNFILPSSMTLTDMFKSIGNGVPYVMASALAQTIHNFLSGV